jgi:hypothetical protein
VGFVGVAGTGPHHRLVGEHGKARVLLSQQIAGKRLRLGGAVEEQRDLLVTGPNV